MNLITKFILRFAIFWVINSLVDVYVFDKPINHLLNISIALIVSSVILLFDLNDRRLQNEQKEEE